MNFTYGETRPQPHYRRHTRTRKQPRTVVPFDKDRFVQSNYRFIVDSNKCDVDKCRNDPDYAVDWNVVEEVICTSTTVPSCTICMDEPICPKMTKCGHVFCWTCLLQYMSSGKQTWKRCPLCFESVYPNALKSVRYDVVRNCEVGQRLSFALVERPRWSTMPKWDSDPKSFEVIAMEDPLKSSPLHRVTATENIIPILSKEQSQLVALRRKILESENMVERADMSRVLPFIETALDQIQKRSATWCKEHTNQNSCLKVNPLSVYRPELDAWGADEESGAAETKASTPAKPKSKLSASAPEWKPAPKRQAKNGSSYFYYQAADGQQIFLHGVNYRCLLHEHKDVDGIPNKFTAAKILFKERFPITEETRGKYKFLGHLPLTTEVTVCFIDMKGLVSSETLKQFREPLLNQKKKIMKLKKAQRLETERKKKHDRMIQQAPLLDMLFKNSNYAVESQSPELVAFDEAAFPDLVDAKLSDGERSTPSSSPVITGFKDVLQKGYVEKDWPTLLSAMAPPATTGYAPPDNGRSILKQRDSGSIPQTASRWPRGGTTNVAPSPQSALWPRNNPPPTSATSTSASSQPPLIKLTKKQKKSRKKKILLLA